MKDYRKLYYQKNKDTIKDTFKKYISENNPYDKITCPDCNSQTVKCSFSKHRKSKKCILSRNNKLIQSLDNNINSDNEDNLLIN